MNNYLRDAGFFLRNAVALISEEMNKDDVIIACLLSAVGMERLLKGILYDLNPVYILKSQEFKHSVQTLYRDSLLKGVKRNEELADKPNEDVISFRIAILRAELISETTRNHKNLLFALSSSRNIIVHADLEQFDADKAKLLIFRDLYILLRSYAGELSIKIEHFIGGLDFKLIALSSKFQESVEKKIHLKLESHLKRWKQLEKVPGYIEKARRKTVVLKEKLSSSRVTECPACKNEAIVEIDAYFEYDNVTGESHFIGVFVKGLICKYCKLVISDYDEIDFLNLHRLLEEPYYPYDEDD